MTLDEAIKDLEYGTKQLEMEIKSGLWIKGSEPELICKEGIALNKQHIEQLTELKDLREENKVLTQECDRLIKEKGELNELKEKAVLDICRREARLKEAKRLLKAAVEDFRRATQGCIGIQCDSCPHTSTHKGCVWRHADEALKLIGDEPNGI